MSRIPVLPFVVSLSLSITVSAEEGIWPEELMTPRAEATRVAVLEWCEVQGGRFHLTDEGHPFCVLFDSASEPHLYFMGEWRLERANVATWWWMLRNNQTPDVQAGVLWLVDPTNHPPIDESSGLVDVSPEIARHADLVLECAFTRRALNNPARLPVYLIGPGVDECLAWMGENE